MVAALMIGAALMAVPQSSAQAETTNATARPAAGAPPEAVTMILHRDSVPSFAVDLRAMATAAVDRTPSAKPDSASYVVVDSVQQLRWSVTRSRSVAAVNPANLNSSSDFLRAGALIASVQARHRYITPVALVTRHASYRASRVVGLNAFPLYL
jgi:hypothetical protein